MDNTYFWTSQRVLPTPPHYLTRLSISIPVIVSLETLLTILLTILRSRGYGVKSVTAHAHRTIQLFSHAPWETRFFQVGS